LLLNARHFAADSTAFCCYLQCILLLFTHLFAVNSAFGRAIRIYMQEQMIFAPLPFHCCLVQTNCRENLKFAVERTVGNL